MSHDLEAAWAAAEVAKQFKLDTSLCFNNPPDVSQVSVFATREGKTNWPHADAVVKLEHNSRVYDIALEFKRANEGLHGILTGIGQSLAYLHKGYAGSVVVLPREYDTLQNTPEYINGVLDCSTHRRQVGVLCYDSPDLSLASPFSNRINCVRSIALDDVAPSSSGGAQSSASTQWAHLREGSSFPSAFFRYLQCAKQLSGNPEYYILPKIPLPLAKAIKEINDELSTSDAQIKYLSNSTSDQFHDQVWQTFWFRYVFTTEVIPIYEKAGNGKYVLNDAHTKLERADGNGLVKFFSGRSDSVKNKLVRLLNASEIDEGSAWIEFAKNVRARAHSFREDVDSGLEHLGLLDVSGRPTEIGYRFVDTCERTGDPNTGTPKKILSAALLKNGQLGAFLHYVYKLSEELFEDEPFSFAVQRGRGNYHFDDQKYLNWLEDKLANDLAVMRKVSLRGGVRRKPFQAELSVLRSFGFVKNFRIGTGLEINWPLMQETIEYEM